MKKISLFLLIIVVIIGGVILFFYQPRFIATPQQISKFFNLPVQANSLIVPLDEIHSQGKKGALGFGIDNYWLKINGNPDILCKYILEAGGVKSDSTYSISKVRGDIEGTLIIYKNKSTGHLRFAEIE